MLAQKLLTVSPTTTSNFYALYAWGSGVGGALGLNNFDSQSSPVQVGTSSWSQINSGLNHVLAIKSDGTLWTWGDNTYGQITVNSLLSWSIVSAGASGTSAIRSDGALFVWGRGIDGEVGNGLTINQSSPVQIGTSSWAQVESGSFSTYAIDQLGRLYAWGRNLEGQLGDGTAINKSSPIQIGTDSWTSISSNDNSVLAIRNDGALFAWGNNFYGQLGITPITSSTLGLSSPVQIGTSSWNQVKSGSYFTLALRSDNTLFSWGLNNFGQLGYTIAYSWVYITANSNHTMAIRSDGALFTWGDNSYGQLGTQNTINQSVPTQIGTSSWSQVDAGANYSTAIRSDGRLFTWGLNDSLQLGIDSYIRTSWSQLSIGLASFGIDYQGRLYSWGSGLFGQLGNNSISQISRPTQIGTSSWTSVSTTLNVVLAIRADGALFAGWCGCPAGRARHGHCRSPCCWQGCGRGNSRSSAPQHGIGRQTCREPC